MQLLEVGESYYPHITDEDTPEGGGMVILPNLV